jgi:hypothetical protein
MKDASAVYTVGGLLYPSRRGLGMRRAYFGEQLEHASVQRRRLTRRATGLSRGPVVQLAVAGTQSLAIGDRQVTLRLRATQFFVYTTEVAMSLVEERAQPAYLLVPLI